MKLQSPTLILVFVAIALGGFVAALELFQDNSDEAVGDRQVLFEFAEADVERLTVETQDQQLQFAKAGEQWQMRSPSLAPADEATVVFLINLLVSAESDRVFEVNPENLSDFGFSPPLATIEVELKNDDTHRLTLGTYDFDRSHIYAQTENAIAPEPPSDNAPPPSDAHPEETDDPNDTVPTAVDVLLVSPNLETAVNRPIEDWLQSEESDTDTNTDTESSDTDSPDPETTDSGTSEVESPGTTNTEATD